ncbi:MAG: hypothetical protein M1838_002483 [Thelocarpon superellum]|nr:MAG: hypothetical protein M1838_002483 [Thelocarpon superellum]
MMWAYSSWMRILAGWTIVSIVRAVPSTNFDPRSWAAHEIIQRDVVIIGGGSTGTYSAIGLRDLNKSVVVVEKENRLGGATQTYIDPKTQDPIDIGVVVFENLDIVKNYFARFNIPLTTASFSSPGAVTEYVNFRTGEVASNFTPTDPSAALAAYGAQAAKYPYLEAGFDLPYPVPDDLLLAFGDFVKKYNLQCAVQFIFSFAQGLGDLLAQPTIYVLKNFGLSLLEDLQTGFLTTAHHDNSELYEKARAELGPDALLSSKVLATERGDSGVKVVVATPAGPKLILAGKMVLSIPPKLRNLAGFDLDHSEHSLFAQFGNSAYYTGVLANTNLPDQVTLQNIDLNTQYNIPVLPGIYSVAPSGVPGLFNVKVGAATAIGIQGARDIIFDSFRALHTHAHAHAHTHTSSSSSNSTYYPAANPSLAVFESHTPFELTVPAAAIAGGFYKQLYALQGHRSTFYTGAAFHTHNSALLWQFTQALLPSFAS